MELTTPPLPRSSPPPKKTIHLWLMPGMKSMLWDEQDGIQIKVKVKLLTGV